MPIPSPIRRYTLATLTLLLASRSWAAPSLQERYEQIRQGLTTTLPGTTIAIHSAEADELLSAETTSILHHPYDTLASALDNAANWCRFMPLHFNIKACTHELDGSGTLLQIYSGRKHYQKPDESYRMAYRFKTLQHGSELLQLQLSAKHGPAGTRDYRIEITARPVAEGTLLHISSSYRPSLLSSMLSASYLATLGRDKVGFSREGGEGYVKGIRGVIERNVMRYHLAIDAFLAQLEMGDESGHEAMLAYWFEHNDNYPQQLHEMPKQEYLTIKRQERQQQLQLQQAIDERARLAAIASSKEGG